MDSQTKTHRFDWASLIIGILFLIAGFVSFMRPDKTLHLLSVIMGVGFLLYGIYELLIRRRWVRTLGGSSGWVIFSGLVDLFLGILFIFYPGFGALYIAIIFAIWFMFDSIMDFMMTRTFKGVASAGYYWTLVILSIVGFILGIVLLFSPMISAMTIVWIISTFLIVFGVVKIIQAF